jgi:hypothetical protein
MAVANFNIATEQWIRRGRNERTSGADRVLDRLAESPYTDQGQRVYIRTSRLAVGGPRREQRTTTEIIARLQMPGRPGERPPRACRGGPT